MAHGGFYFLRMHARCAITDHAGHGVVGHRDRGTNRLTHAGAKHPHFHGGEHAAAQVCLGIEHRPDGRVATVGDNRALCRKELAHERRRVRGVQGSAVVLERALEFFGEPLEVALIIRHPFAPPRVRHLGTALGEANGERAQKNAHIGAHRHFGGFVGAERGIVNVHLHRALFRRCAPVGRLAPPVGFTEARAEHERGVGLIAHEVVQLDVRHRNGERR